MPGGGGGGRGTCQPKGIASCGPLTRIGTTQAIATIYTDRDVQSGRTYRYAVTALDRAKQANESPRSNEVTVTIP